MLKILLVLSLVSQLWALRSFYYVKVSYGKMMGPKADESDGNYTTFFGVPYAMVDEKRPFENTLDTPKYKYQYNATNPSVICPQVAPGQRLLQCLRMNIYVPGNVGRNISDLPVFVWFHGGGLAFGAAKEYNATHLVQEGVIVVTVNYRLGPYGFLCTSDIKNQGLEDMKKALKWIKNEIHAFGGDANKVTIGGESWGASAVDFLLHEEAYFKKAILESGSRFSFGVSTRMDNSAPIKLAAHLGFNTTNHREAVTFLSSVDPIKVMQASQNLSLIFGVCETPGGGNLSKNAEKIKETPILIGYNSKEAFADFATQPDSFYTTIEEELVNNLMKTFNLPDDELQNLTDLILRFYLGSKTISRDALLELIDLSSDFRVNYGAERSVANYLKLGNPNVYKYVFSYIGGSAYKNMTGVGAYHTEELPYLFEWGTPLKTEEQREMRRGMVRLWTNFIKYGNPTPTQGERGWLPTNVATRRYFNIDVEGEAGMRNYAYHQRVAFWDLLWSAYGQYAK